MRRNGAQSGLIPVAIAHDYLTQRGGAERVVLALLQAFPEAPVYTALYHPSGTYPEFKDVDVRVSGLNRVSLFRRRHRLALPFLAPTFTRMLIPAQVTLCSSSGWAHGARSAGRKVVYCYNPARWLYQHDVYLDSRSRATRAALALLRPYLRRWDVQQAATADRYIAISSVVRERIASRYHVDAEVIPPPPGMAPAGRQRALPGIEAGFVLCVSRLLPYKNVERVIEAFRLLPTERLLVVGTGPLEAQLRHQASPNVHLLGQVADEGLRWAYANCSGIIAASYEDFGLVPLEAAAFGKPSAVLRWGGFLDTVRPGLTGVTFERPEPGAIAAAIRQLRTSHWDAAGIRAHAENHSLSRFIARLRAIVTEERELLDRATLG
jgi:glycosyltransferase involved in cell wall biosynthesis